MTTPAPASHQDGYAIGALPFRWTAGQMSIALTIVALVLWAYAITEAEFEIGFLGLIASFPVTFFVALGILTLASAILWVSKERHDILLFLQLSFLVVSIWAMPIAIGGASSPDAKTYADLGFIEYVTRTGHFDAGEVWQHYWPSAWIFWAAGMQVCGLGSDTMAALIPWLPFLWQCAMFPPVFLFFRNTIGKERSNYCWAAIWLFYLASWHETQNTGAQAFGIYFFLVLLAMMTTSPVWEQALRSARHVFVATIILAASAVTHLLGSMVATATVAALVATKRVRVPHLVLMAFLFIAAWSIYGAMHYFEWQVSEFWEAGFRLDLATQRGVLSPLSSSGSNAAVALARILYSGLVLALAGLGALVGWRVRTSRYTDVTVLAIASSCGIVALVVGAGYYHELYQRFFVFVLPALAYTGIKLLRLKGALPILLLVLLAGLPLTFVAKYGNQRIDYLSTGYRCGAAFFEHRTTTGFLVAELPIGRMANWEQYRSVYSHDGYEELEKEGSMLILDADGVVTPLYVCISNHDRAELDYYWSEPQVADDAQDSLSSATNFDLVYANPDLALYVSELQ